MPKIIELPSGSFNARVFDYTDPNGKRHYKSFTADSKREVKLLIADFLAHRKENDATIPNITVGEAIDRYINSNRNVLSPTTIRSYEGCRRVNMQGVMHIPISRLTSYDLQTEVDKMAENLSPKTVAERYGLVVRSVSTFLPDKKFKVNLPQKIKNEIQIPEKDEMTKLLKAAEGTAVEIPLYLAAMCGMRRSEIAGLKWEDVDFDKGTLFIHQTIVINSQNEYVTRNKTKTTSSRRTIKVFAPVMDALKRAERQGEYVTALNPGQIYKHYIRLRDKCNLPKYRFHSLRHYCVSVMLSLNIPKNYIADFVGHDSERMIDEVYGHIMSTAKDTFMDVAEQFFTKMQHEMHHENLQTQ